MPAVAAVHGAVDAHEYCVEHQAFEHRSGDADARADHDSGDAIGASIAQDQHDDCTFDDALLRNGVHVAAVAIGATVPSPTHDRALPSVDAPTPLAALVTAPKTSPPAP